MPWRIIVASSNADQLAELMNGAEEIAATIEAAGDVARVRSATSVADIKQLRARSPGSQSELLIITASLPEHRSSPNFAGLPGLNLVKALQAEPLPCACILVSDREEHWEDVRGMKSCELLCVNAGTNYVDDCLRLGAVLGVGSPRGEGPEKRPPLGNSTGDTATGAESRVAPDAAPDRSQIKIAAANEHSVSNGVAPAVLANEPYALIEVDLPGEARYATVRLVVKHPQRPKVTPAARLNLKQRDIDKFIEDSRALSRKASKLRNWPQVYRLLGERVFKLLNTREFVGHYNYAQAAVGEDVRLRFNLGRPVFDGLWESIFDPSAGGRYLMLDTSITRRDLESIDQFADQQAGEVGVLNVLVIAAEVPENAAPVGPDDQLWRASWGRARLNPLPHVATEAEMLQELENAPRPPESGATARGALKIQVEVLSERSREKRTGRKSWSLAEEVERKLKEHPGQYDVVHFAGHALVPEADAKDDRGYLIFSGVPSPQAVPISKVAGWLKGTSAELVYLSCCKSNAAKAAAEFARNNVRMTIGFNWELDDAKAVEFAKLFYTELLRRQLKVCSAMREARRQLHNNQGGDPTWASPVLVAQPSDWQYVERVLRPPVRAVRSGERLARKPRKSPRQSRPMDGLTPP
jgi:hypothetical protein